MYVIGNITFPVITGISLGKSYVHLDRFWRVFPVLMGRNVCEKLVLDYLFDGLLLWNYGVVKQQDAPCHSV